MPFGAGHRIGRYEIRSLIGAGGMGEVYLAHDTKLERKVALKVLLGTATSSEDRLRRFAQEARAASALNHPNIATVYDVDVEDGTRYISAEFVEGETLRVRLRRERLPVTEALRIATQVADALAAAHREGIVHRDIKPENILLRPDGYVKVVDFGLAKLTETAGESQQTEVATRAAHNTDAGVVLGTVAYMSPEQARGLRVDQRTDVWSLGVVFYEMVTGRRPFDGPTSSDLIARILHNDPPKVAPLVPEATGEIELVLETALAKDVDERYQTARDFLNALKRVRRHLDAEAEHRRATPSAAPGSGTVSSPTLTPAPSDAVSDAAPSSSAVRTQSSVEIITNELRRHRTALLAACVGLLAVIGFGGYAAYRGFQRPRPLPFEHFKVTRLTTTGRVADATISPDGRYVALTLFDNEGASLWVRQVKTDGLVNIVPTAPGRYTGITFSPDGEYVYYVRREPEMSIATLYQAPVLGGTSQKVLEHIDSKVTFSPDGTEMAYLLEKDGSSVMVAKSDGTRVRRVATATPPASFPNDDFYSCTGPAWSPDGHSIAATIVENNVSAVALIDPVSGNFRRVGSKRWYQMCRLGWLADSSAVLASAKEGPGSALQVWLLPTNGDPPRQITSDTNNYLTVGATASGTAFVTVQGSVTGDVWVAPDGDAARATKVTDSEGSAGGLAGLAWTPDGRLVYVNASNTGAELWIMNADGSGKRRILANGSSNVGPEVSPDGKALVFMSDREGHMDVWRTSLDGNDAQRITKTDVEVASVSITPDSQTVIYGDVHDQIWQIPIAGGTPRKITDRTWSAVVSRDGQSFVAMYRNPETAPVRIAIYPFQGGTPSRVLDVPKMFNGDNGVLSWGPDGRTLQFLGTRDGVTNVWNLDPATGVTTQVTHFATAWMFDFRWSPDGRKLAVSRGIGHADAVLVSETR
jgi:eukaryotic-like serine/threonine-protein kinase